MRCGNADLQLMVLTSVMLNGQKQLASARMTTMQHVWGLDPIHYCSQHVFWEAPFWGGLARGFDACLRLTSIPLRPFRLV